MRFFEKRRMKREERWMSREVKKITKDLHKELANLEVLTQFYGTQALHNNDMKMMASILNALYNRRNEVWGLLNTYSEYNYLTFQNSLERATERYEDKVKAKTFQALK